MKFYYRVLLDFVGLAWQYLVPFATRVSLMFFANPLFSGCTITKAEFDAAILDLQTKGAANIHGTEITKTARDEAYDLLMGLMRQLAEYTNFKATGDMAIILNSGFNSTTPHSHGGKGGLSAVNGEISGDVDLSWGKIPNARSYIVRYCLNVDGQRDIFVISVPCIFAAPLVCRSKIAASNSAFVMVHPLNKGFAKNINETRVAKGTKYCQAKPTKSSKTL